MSTFGGKFEEIPGISADRFDGENLDSHCYFLSHCHTDHMYGLGDYLFKDRLKQDGIYLYASHVTGEILKRLHPDFAPKIQTLDFKNATSIHLPNGDVISVQIIPAGHCPGSVMFLFETVNGNILYTGDFRIKPSDIPKIKAFYNSLGHLKTIHKMYLDTTFFLKCHRSFPPRHESLHEICSIIKEWTSKSDKHVIKLNTPAKYGYEYLFMEINEHLKSPVHVNEEVFEFYKCVPEMDGCVTRKANDTQIHSACGVVWQDICCNGISYEIKNIRISAWKWKNKVLEDGISSCFDHKEASVCYSTHASYEECAALIKFLKPLEIDPSVLHRHEERDAEIYNNIKEHQLLNVVKNEEEQKNEEPKNERKSFKIQQSTLDSDETKAETCHSKDVVDLLNLLDWPPKKKRKD